MDASPVNLDKKLGAAFLGNVIAAILYGITCIQALQFFRKRNRGDSLPFRVLIFFLWSLNTAHVALITHALYSYLISNYGNMSSTRSAVWSIISQVFSSATSDVVIRSFFARRVWLLTNHNDYLFVLITIPNLLSFATACAAAIRAFDLRTFGETSRISYLIYLSLAAGVASDVLIAGTLWVSFWRNQKSDSILTALTVSTINTTLLTTACSIACLVTFAVWPQELIYIAIYFSLSELHLNSLLTTLNTEPTPDNKCDGIMKLASAARPHMTTRPQPAVGVGVGTQSTFTGTQTQTQTTSTFSASASETDMAITTPTPTRTLSSPEALHALPIWYRHHHHRASLGGGSDGLGTYSEKR
ncbi:hypothetical protein LshimejAT787_1301320 [Lyophyllum shimeji]|uniref:DUF6534 domain-containing protein n=1 Tax=Lyophyllum shimeji TaxID=47721 RepID=A0A9P3PY03_LYOSH|nr:hypothetical protein LshimejAT787_1301320 [Lyophyllum shimeji]